MTEDPTIFADEPVETGFVTATVTTADMTDAMVQAARALIRMPTKTPVELAQLAREIAQDLDLTYDTLKKHGLTQAHYDFLCEHNKFFKNVLETEIKNWQSITTTDQRVRLQALAALETQLPQVASRMGNAAEKLSDVVEAGKLLADIGGVKAIPAGPASVGERYQINIDLGADTRIVISAQVPTDAGAGAAAAGPVSKNPEIKSVAPSLRPVANGQTHLPALPEIPEG